MAVDPTNADNLSSGDVPLAQLGNVPASDTSGLEDDIALLGFKVASNGSLAKYNLVDQTVDDFQDTSGVDASASTDEIRDSTGKYYSGVSPSSSTAYTYAGSTTSLAVITGITYTIKTWGAGGGTMSGGPAGGPNWPGAAGGFSTGTYSFGSGTTLIIGVGGAGPAGFSSGTGGWPGGGPRGPISGSGQGGANGGGYSGVFIGSQVHANSLQIAGAGGGGYYYAPHGGATAGGGGGSSGTDSASGSGGTQVGGGSGGSGAGALQGATGGGGSIGGSGGGGGYYGGGGSNGYGDGGGSGGGGSGFVATTATINSIAVTAESVGATTASVGTDMNSTGTSDSDYPGGSIGNQSNNGGVYISASESYSNMTLVSNATTAEAAPTKGDIVFTYTNGGGTNVVGTDITADYSADDGSNWTPFSIGTGDVQGTTGGHTIVAKHDVALTSTSGTAMRYRIKTLNQTSSKYARIQAVSLGWS
jgi:hypothetical protein